MKKIFIPSLFTKQTLKALAFGAGVLIISLMIISFNPLDQSWFYYSSQSANITNYFGRVGATIAALLFFICGSAVWVLLALLWYLTYLLWYRISLKTVWDTLIAYVWLWCSASAILNAYHIDYNGIAPGGLVGRLFYAFWLRLFTDEVVVMLWLYTSLIVCIVLITQLAFAQYTRPVVRLLKTIYQSKAMQITIAGVDYGYKKLCAAISILKKYLFGNPKKEKNSLDRLLEAIVQEEFSQSNSLYDNAFWDQFPVAKKDASPVATIALNDVKEDKKNYSSTIKASSLSPINMQTQIAFNELTFDDLPYQIPPVDALFSDTKEQASSQDVSTTKHLAMLLEQKLERFGIQGKVVSIKQGPVLTMFEYEPHIDSKISKIIALEDDLALALQAVSIRIIAPIPGKSVVGFEVAHQKQKTVSFASLVKSKTFKQFTGKLPLIIGHDVIGNDMVVDLAAMPHLLLAGSTGSGKSVALNVMLMSLLCSRTPDQLRLILIDPKRLEFATYADIPHLLFPIVTEPKHVVAILSWLVHEMEDRYRTMARYNVRNIDEYHKKLNTTHSMPYIVTMIDELADLMMCVGKDVEDLIARIAQMARAAGIHLIVATQRPSVDVITGLIKVNFPCRISCKVASKIDSRTILDTVGADKLLGKGDMLFLDTSSQIRRVHGAFVAINEIEKTVTHIKKQRPVAYQELINEQTDCALPDEDQQLYQEVLSYIKTVDEVSISLLQRKFRIGFNRSARFIELLESQGLVLPSQGGKARKVIKSVE